MVDAVEDPEPRMSKVWEREPTMRERHVKTARVKGGNLPEPIILHCVIPNGFQYEFRSQPVHNIDFAKVCGSPVCVGVGAGGGRANGKVRCWSRQANLRTKAKQEHQKTHVPTKG